MTAREFLSRPEDLRREICRRRFRAETLRRLAAGSAPSLREVRVLSTPDPTRFQALLAEAADEEQEILRLEEERLQALTDAALAVTRLPDSRLSRLLELRYLEGLSWHETALRMNYGESTVFRLHQQALALLPLPPEAAGGVGGRT